jgi:hypothetical protein
MNKRLNYALIVLCSISIIVMSFYIGSIDATIDIMSSQIDLMVDSSQLTIFPNQGRIPDTTIDGIDYYRAN